ncbi:hypothetical protein FQZ97_877720 [compost metagenome]
MKSARKTNRAVPTSRAMKMPIAVVSARPPSIVLRSRKRRRPRVWHRAASTKKATATVVAGVASPS